MIGKTRSLLTSLSVPTVCSYMLASAVDLLKGQELCGFLKDMDAEENKGLSDEGENIKQQLSDLEVEYSWSNIATEGICEGVKKGAGAALAYAFCSYGGEFVAEVLSKNSRYPQLSSASTQRLELTNLRSVVIISGLVGGIASCGIAGYKINELLSIYKNRKLNLETAFVLTDVHELRLKAKIRDVEERSQNMQEEIERKQLPLASDWFINQSPK